MFKNSSKTKLDFDSGFKPLKVIPDGPITNPSDKYGFKLVVRFSDHEAMTGRSECADLDYNMTSLLTTWNSKFESGLITDENGDYDYEVTEFNTQEERDLAFFNGVVAEITYKLDF